LPTTEKPTTEKPTTEKPTTKKPTTDESIADHRPLLAEFDLGPEHIIVQSGCSNARDDPTFSKRSV
jgi:hypothetical protein